MKLVIAIVLAALLAFTLGLYLPWWSISLAAFFAGLIIPQSAFRSFLAGFAGIFLLWGGMAFWIDLQNQHILSSRLAALFPLGGKGWTLVLVTAVVGGLIAGTASWCGGLLRNWMHSPRPGTA